MTRLLELQQKIADDAAQSDVEYYCPLAERNDIGTWYSDVPQDPELAQTVADAIEYLTLRNRIGRHSDHANWVRVNFGA